MGSSYNFPREKKRIPDRSTGEDSGNPSVSANIPLGTPFDRQSGGRVPARVVRGQRYVVVLESIDSGDTPELVRQPEATVSGQV